MWSAPEDHGRPWDDPDYHTSPLGKILLPIAIIVLVIIAIGWILSNRETVGKILKNGFAVLCVGALIVGFVIIPLLDENDTSEKDANTTISTNVKPNSNKPQKGEVGYKTKTYRIDVCRTCDGTGKYKIDANWGNSSVQCPTCHGSGKEEIPGNYR